jgi:maleate isomerase
MPSRTLLGVLTPSSNTRLEPLTSAMLAATPSVSAHFTRFRVTGTGLGAAGQFDPGPIVEAAGLLAELSTVPRAARRRTRLLACPPW